MNRHRMLASGYFADVVVGGDPDFKYTVDIDETGIYAMRVATGTYDCTIDWGDGSPLTVVNEINVSINPSFGTHDYGGAGIFQITISGLFAGHDVNDRDANNVNNIITIDNWGTTPFIKAEDAFNGTNITAINAPDGAGKFANVPSIEGLFNGCRYMATVDFGKFLSSLPLSTSAATACYGLDALVGKGSLYGTDKIDMVATTSCTNMFRGSDDLDPEIAGWDVRNMAAFHTAFHITSFSNDSFSDAVIAYRAQDLDHGIQSGVPFSASGATTNSQEALDAKNYLINTKGWSFS